MSKSDDASYKVKDILIEYGQAFQITKIEKGEQDKTIHYCTYFVKPNQQRIFCTIPESALAESGTRKPISSKEGKSVLRSLKQSADPLVEVESVDIDNLLQLNDIFQTSAVVKMYWKQKQDPDTNFSSTKDNLYQSGIDQITEELSVVFDSKPEDMQEKILKNLAKK